jgi:hypothetical protein
MDSGFPVLIAYPNFYPRLWGIPAVDWISRWLLTGLFRCLAVIPVPSLLDLAVAWLAQVVKLNTGFLDADREFRCDLSAVAKAWSRTRITLILAEHGMIQLM